MRQAEDMDGWIPDAVPAALADRGVVRLTASAIGRRSRPTSTGRDSPTRVTNRPDVAISNAGTAPPDVQCKIVTVWRHPNHRPLASLPLELRRTSVPDHVRDWVKNTTGSTVVRTRRLPGASSAALHRLDLADGSRLVLRRYAWRAYVAAEPEAPRRETDALCFARRHGLAVPELVAADVTGDHVGDGVPVVLVTLLPGRPEAVPDVERLAEVAASIHEISADDLGHEYFPWYEEEMTTPPPLTERRGLWELAIELWRRALPEYRATFIHRDFHPGNLLWSRSRLTGVVDWSAACRGPIGCDIAHCRANLRDLAGAETGDRFVAAYTAATGEALEQAHWGY